MAGDRRGGARTQEKGASLSRVVWLNVHLCGVLATAAGLQPLALGANKRAVVSERHVETGTDKQICSYPHVGEHKEP